MMEAIIGNLEAMIAMYAPIVLTYVAHIIDWLVLWKKLKTINVKRDINETLGDLVEQNKQLVQDNAELRKQNKEILEQLTRIKQED